MLAFEWEIKGTIQSKKIERDGWTFSIRRVLLFCLLRFSGPWTEVETIAGGVAYEKENLFGIGIITKKGFLSGIAFFEIPYRFLFPLMALAALWMNELYWAGIGLAAIIYAVDAIFSSLTRDKELLRVAERRFQLSQYLNH